MKHTLVIFCFLATAAISACAPTSNMSNYTQAQISAITTREVQANFDSSYRAATDSLFDAGYTIDVSDSTGGIITGTKEQDRTSARIWISPYISDTSHKISVLLRRVTASRTTVRLSMSRNGEPYIHEESIDEFWRLMQRQVLMKEIPE